MSIVDADPTLPLALALAPPAVALAILDVAIYRRKQEPGTGLRSLDRAIGNGEEKIREDNENGKGETHRGLHPVLLLAGGRRLVAGDGDRRRSSGRLVGRRLRASVEGESDVRLCVTVWPVRG